MDFDFGEIGDYVREHPKAAAVAVVGTAGIILFVVIRRPKGEDKPVDRTSEVYAPMEGQPIGAPAQYSNYPVINVTVPPQPGVKTPQPATEPGRSFHSIMREGRALQVTAGPAGICPPGYVSAQQPGQPPRCTLVNDANKKPGQRTSYVPSMGQTPFVSK